MLSLLIIVNKFAQIAILLSILNKTDKSRDFVVYTQQN